MLSFVRAASRLVFAGVVTIGAPLAGAQFSEVVPPDRASVAGNSGNSIPLGDVDGVYQILYEPGQLVGLPIGGKITSIQLRLRNPETSPWPAAPLTITSYQISLGGSTRSVSTISTTFADNITSPVIVRSGALNLAAGAYPAGAASGLTPEAWGPEITFDTSYTYTGGPLVIEFRHDNPTSSTVFADADTSGSLDRVAAVASTSSSAATTGNITTELSVRFRVDPANPASSTLPNANDAVAGNSSNFIPLGRSTGGRHLSLYSEDQFAEIPKGSLITGLRLRQRNAEVTPWPGSAFACADYEIWLAQSPLTPATISSTFANNVLNPVQVRDGARGFEAGEYPGGAATGTTPEGWGPLIRFDTPYVYRGGVLAIEFRNTGGGAPNNFADATNSTGATAGLGSAGSPTSTTGFTGPGMVVRLSYLPPNTYPFGRDVTKIFALKNFADTFGQSSTTAYAFNFSIANQVVFAPGQFQTIGPGTLLTALAYRSKTTSVWPAAPTTATEYSIELSRSANGPDTLSTTIANNVGPDAVTVRSGPLSVGTGEMAPVDPVWLPAPFTFTMPFQTPYPYRYGSLLNVVRQSGFPIGNTPVDAAVFSSPQIGVDTRAYSGLPKEALITGGTSNAPVIRYSADAQVMVPNSAKNGIGLSSNYVFNSPYADTESTFQYVLGASELTYIPVGGLITSMSLLADPSNPAWPDAAGAWADDLSVEISSAANVPQNASTTFAANTGPDAQIVRSGPISWNAGALPAGATTNFGGTITFDRGFVYKGGPICITVRHSPVISNFNPTLRSAGPGSATRAIRSGGKASNSGSFIVTNTGAAIQLGYIPAGTSPKAANTTPANNQRNFFGLARTLQMLFDPAAVGVPVGATINGVTWRLRQNETADFPTADLIFSRFDLWMSTSPNSAATASTTIADNDGIDLVQVRSGPLTLGPRSWSAVSQSDREDWGVFIQFTRPFVYQGGTLAFTCRASTPSGASPNGFFEAQSDSAPVTDSQALRDTSSPDATTGAFVKPPTTLFAFTDDAFCPWDLNNDGAVDDLDFQVFVLAYNTLDCKDPAMAFGCVSDFTLDGVVDDADFLPFVQAYNTLLCP